MAVTFDEVSKAQYVLLTTFTKDGRPKPTPIWIAPDGDRALVITEKNAWKVKRIRNNAQVMVSPCTRMGEVTGEWVSGQASIDETPEGIALVETLLRRKVGIAFAVFRRVDKIRDRRRGGRRVCVRVSFPQ